MELQKARDKAEELRQVASSCIGKSVMQFDAGDKGGAIASEGDAFILLRQGMCALEDAMRDEGGYEDVLEDVRAMHRKATTLYLQSHTERREALKSADLRREAREYLKAAINLMVSEAFDEL